MATVTLRTATLEDASAIAELITELGYPTAPDAMHARLTALLTEPQHATFVAVADGRLVGVTGVRVERGFEIDGVYGRLLVLVVAADARGAGIGAQLVEAANAWAAANGAAQIVVNTATHRTRAHQFYERCGYQRTGIRLVKALSAAGLVLPEVRSAD
jgi:GNAT superfamily N-acetyltransferase